VVLRPDGRCLIQTLDFFTPIVDDPYDFGAIAAANSLSDVYAMGGQPLTAMNILCWDDSLPEHILVEILRGGADKVAESGAMLVGGHSVTAPELKFGLSVTGEVDGDAFWTNAGARVGDELVLTKPLGTGVLTTAAKRDRCPEDALKTATETMARLNRNDFTGVHACTDVTGFGLAGHAWEIARASGVRLEFSAQALPLLPEALRLAGEGHLTRGDKSNRRLVGEALRMDGVHPDLQRLIVDPQTSGGLLVSAPPGQVSGTVVGHVVEGPPAVRFR
jgi:selenide,water dikinase